MTTTINATTTALGGAIVTGDNSGQLGLQGDGVTQITVTNSGVTFASPSTVLSGLGGVSLTGTETLTNKTVTNIVFDGSMTEEVYTLGTSGTLALDPANGTVQTCAAAGTVTFTDSLAAGQSIVLMLTNGASFTINWPTTTWVTSAGNAAPTLTAADTVVFWKISTTLYAAYVGSYV